MPQAHRTRAFVFTDIEASTRGWEQQPAEMRQAVEFHDAIVAGGIATHGGTVVKTTGDGAMAAFDDPLDAVAARRCHPSALRPPVCSRWRPALSRVDALDAVYSGFTEGRGYPIVAAAEQALAAAREALRLEGPA